MATKSELLDLITALRISLGWALVWVSGPELDKYEDYPKYRDRSARWLDALHEAKELEEKLGRLDKELV